MKKQYARHILTTSGRENRWGLHQFVQKLVSLNKDCDFQAFTAMLYTDGPIDNALVSGLWSSTIWKKLFAQHELSLGETHQFYRSLEPGQKRSQSHSRIQPRGCCSLLSLSSHLYLFHFLFFPIRLLWQPLNKNVTFVGTTDIPVANSPPRKLHIKTCGKTIQFQCFNKS